MVYKYYNNENYEDLSSGRVIYHKANYANYPVKLAVEIFCRCLKHLDEQDKKINLYDPCCGSAYLLTVLGFLFNNKIKVIYASDISEIAISLAKENLSLLSTSGIKIRKEQLCKLVEMYDKASHKEALNSLSNLSKLCNSHIDINTFIADILNEHTFAKKNFPVDIIITDVPYGNLVDWSNTNVDAVNILLNTMIPLLNKNSIVAISCNKKQKISNVNYIRLEKFQVGHRKVEILKIANSR